MVEQLIAEINARWPLPSEGEFSTPRLKIEQFPRGDGTPEIWEITWNDGSREDPDPSAGGQGLEEALRNLKTYLEARHGES